MPKEKPKYYVLNSYNISEIIDYGETQYLVDKYGFDSERKFDRFARYGWDWNGLTFVYDEETNKKQPKTIDVCFYEGKKGKYFVKQNGKIYKLEGRKKKYLSTHIKSNALYVKIERVKIVQVKKLVYTTFVKNDYNPKKDVIVCKNGNVRDCRVSNLEKKSRSERTIETLNKRRSFHVGLYENGELKKEYISATECAKDLYISKSTVYHTMAGKTKKKLYDLRKIEI